MNRILIILTSLLAITYSYAQKSIESILQEIESNNTTLIALQKEIEAQKLGNKTGIYLPNPEVEFGYLWGNPVEIGNENSFAISQSMDFPTSYGYRKNISNLENQNLDLFYNSERINILLEAKKVLINLAYFNALSVDYEDRVRIAEEISVSYQKMFEKGEIGALEKNQVYMDLINCINEKEKIDIERNSLQNQLIALNGGKEILYEVTKIPHYPLPLNFDEWYTETASLSPALKYLNQQIEISKQQVKLNRALALPKLTAGYADERILGEKLQGITIGITIPLWENKNSIKQSKADVVSYKLSLEDNKLKYFNRLQNLYEKSVSLYKNATKYRQALDSYNSQSLLIKALEAGEITLLNYLYQLEAYYDSSNNLLEFERDYALAVAELTAVTL